MVKEYQKFRDITKADIDKWKKTKGNLTEVTIQLDDDPNGKTAKFVIANPPRTILDVVTDLGQDKKNLKKIEEIMIKSAVLGGDMVYLDTEEGDTQTYLAVLEDVGKRFEPRRSRSRKL
jgi:hypothetical protein